MSKKIRLITLDPPYSRYFRDLVKNLGDSGDVGFEKHYISAFGYLVFGFKKSTLIKICLIKETPSISSKKIVVRLARTLNYPLTLRTFYRAAQYVEWLSREIRLHQINTCLLYNSTRFNHALAICLFKCMGVSYFVFERGVVRGKSTTILSSPEILNLPKLDSDNNEQLPVKHYGTESLIDYVFFISFIFLDKLGQLLGLNLELPDKLLRKKSYSKILFKWIRSKYSPTPTLIKKYLLVPLQLDYDSQVRFFSDFSTTQEFIKTVEGGFYRSNLCDDYELVFTTHPFECKKYIFNVGSKCFSGKTSELMEGASAVVTINSTSGMEAIDKLKPCFVFGEAMYKDESVTLSVTAMTFTSRLNAWNKNQWSPSRENVDKIKRRIFVSTQIAGSVYKYNNESLEQAKQKIIS